MGVLLLMAALLQSHVQGRVAACNRMLMHGRAGCTSL